MKSLNAKTDVRHHQIEQNKTFQWYLTRYKTRNISEDMVLKKLFIFLLSSVFFSSFNRKYLKLVKIDISVLHLNSSYKLMH